MTLDHGIGVQKEKEKPEISALSLNEIYPFISNRHSPLIREMELGTTKLLAILKYSITGIEDPQVALSPYLVKESSRETITIEYRLLSNKKEQDADILFLELSFPALQSGSYALMIDAEERSTKSQSHVEQKFIIR